MEGNEQEDGVQTPTHDDKPSVTVVTAPSNVERRPPLSRSSSGELLSSPHLLSTPTGGGAGAAARTPSTRMSCLSALTTQSSRRSLLSAGASASTPTSVYTHASAASLYEELAQRESELHVAATAASALLEANKKLSDERHGLVDQVQAFQQTVTSLEDELEVAQSRHLALQRNVDKLQMQLQIAHAVARAAEKDAESRAASAHDHTIATESKLKQRLHSVQDERSQLAAALAESRRETQAQQQLVVELRGENKRLRAEIARGDADYSKLRQRVESLENQARSQVGSGSNSLPTPPHLPQVDNASSGAQPPATPPDNTRRHFVGTPSTHGSPQSDENRLVEAQKTIQRLRQQQKALLGELAEARALLLAHRTHASRHLRHPSVQSGNGSASPLHRHVHTGSAASSDINGDSDVDVAAEAAAVLAAFDAPQEDGGGIGKASTPRVSLSMPMPRDSPSSLHGKKALLSGGGGVRSVELRTMHGHGGGVHKTPMAVSTPQSVPCVFRFFCCWKRQPSNAQQPSQA